MRRIVLLLATGLSTGCISSATLVREHNPRSEFEAGAVTISASAPMRWENVVGDLRPEFNSLSAADQLNRVLPITQNDTNARREATSVEVGVNVRGETVTQTGRRVEETTANSASPTVTDSHTIERRQEAPQPVSGVDTAVAPPGTGVFRDLDPPNAAVPSAVDPILQARAAVALHQELVLLDNYLDNAYDPCLQEAWLVRTRVVATPYARNQPLDVYTRIYAWYSQDGVSEDAWQYDGLRLVPLLVTDNFERSDTRRYEQVAAQLQASMNGVSGVLAAGLGFNRYLNNLNAILGTQYNNLLTISQVDDYTLLVRLGAAFSPTSRYEMQSRSYDITFLVVVDKERMTGSNGPIALNFFAASEMRDAQSGDALPPISRGAHRDLVRRLRAVVGDTEEIRTLAARVDPPELWDIVVELRNHPAISEPMYTELLRWALAVEGSEARLPVSRGRVGLPIMQTGVFYDSIGSNLRARVAGASGLNPQDVDASLVVGSAGQDAPLIFAADSVAISPDGVLDATFPSLGALGLNSDARQVSLQLSRRCPARAEEQTRYPLIRNRAVFASATPATVSFAARAVTTTIVPGQNNDATARIAIGGIENRNNPYVFGYAISVTGGAIIDRAERLGSGGGPLPSNAIDPAANAVRVGRDSGAYGLSLSNLTPSSTLTVTVNAIGEGGGVVAGETQTFTISVAARRT